MPSSKITYFSVKALIEPIRFILSYAGVKFEDDCFERENWPKIKSDMPFGQVPVLEVDGKNINQYGLLGKDDWENLKIDTAVPFMVFVRLRSYSEAHPEAKEAKYGSLIKETIPFYSERLDIQVKQNGGYLVGGKLTWADLVLVALLDFFNFITKINIIKKHAN